jgi:hypothetical protein
MSSRLINMISPVKPFYRNVRAALNPAGPAPIIMYLVKFLGSRYEKA